VEDKNLKQLLKIEEDLKKNNTQDVLSNLPSFLFQTKKSLKRFHKILNLSDSQQFELLKLKEKLEKINYQLKLLLDNANEGFLYINSDLKIEPVYSKKIKEIFNQDISDKYIYEVLFNDKKEFYKETLEDILNSDDFRAEVMMSLLPKQKFINGKIVEIEYKKLPDKSFMIILRDISEKINLEKKAKEESEKLKMIVEIVSSSEQFLEIMFEYENFAKHIENYKKHPETLKAKLHTFKGLFAQKYMKNVVNVIHDLEEKIQNNDFSFINYQILLSPVEKDIETIKKILGEDFFERINSKVIEKKRLKKLYLQAKISHADKSLSDGIKELLYFNVNEFIKPFENLIEDLAEKYSKKVNFKYECDLYLPDIYKPFFMSLIHIFRNSVYHGIEDEFERIEAQKSKIANIYFKVKKEKDIEVVIEDDGRGIDLEKLSKKVGKKVSEKDIKEYIFKSGFSLSDEVDLIAGRGVGLFSVFE
jgi:two-component system chemotaxis sensor kinase CheA